MSAPRKQNIGNPERFARVAIGAALALLGIAVLAAGGPALWALSARFLP